MSESRSGQAFAQAVGDKKAVRRYGHAYVPLDEALSRVVVDLSGGRGSSFTSTSRARASANSMSTSFTSSSRASSITRGVTLHVDNLRGANAHHQAETAFKAFGRALRMAVEKDPRVSGVPSTKGAL